MLSEATDRRPWLIGIDDTDNLESRGTGFRARSLVAALEREGIAEAVGVTRHQLLVDDRIPYTSHNSCACIEVRSGAAREALFEFCRTFMLAEAAEGSDVGLCIAAREQGRAIAAYGRQAKTAVLNQDIARTTAAAADIALEGLTGTRDGIIGSLAGIGLFADGNDGRYIWKRKLRDLADDVVSVGTLLAETGIEDVRLPNGNSITEHTAARIALGPWPRPVRIDGLAVLLVEKGSKHELADYECVDKQRIKAIRP